MRSGATAPPARCAPARPAIAKLSPPSSGARRRRLTKRLRGRAAARVAHAATSPRPAAPVIAMPSSSSLAVGGNSPAISPSYMHEDPVGEGEDLLELERHEQDGASLVALLDQPAVHELDRADVEAARGLRGDQNLRVALDLAGEHDLLLVAAGEAAGARASARRRGRRRP